MDWCHAPKVNFVVHSQAPCPYYDIGRRSVESSIKGKFILLPKNFETHAPNRSLKSTLKMYFGGGYGGPAWPTWDTLHPLSKHWLLSYSVLFLIHLPANEPEKAVADGTSIWALAHTQKTQR